MSDELPIFPRGAIAMGNGDLVQVTNVKVSQDNGAKAKHTMRGGYGIVLGNEETTVTFDYEVPEEGAERDYMRDIRRGKIRKLRVKIPGETFTVIGIAKKRDLDMPLDDAIKGTIEFIGRTEI